MLTSCFDGISVKMNKGEIHFVAMQLNYEGELQSGYKVVGKLEITNNSDEIIEFSNKDLYFIIDREGEGRTYVNSIASHKIDHSKVVINKGATLKQNVYWVLPPVKSLETENLNLEWRN